MQYNPIGLIFETASPRQTNVDNDNPLPLAPSTVSIVTPSYRVSHEKELP